MITEDRLTLALTYLATTDSEYAEAVGEVQRAEYMVKTQRAFAFMAAKGSSVKEREALADTEPKVIEAQERHVNAIVAREKFKAKRQTEMTIADQWRTQESSRRQGTI